MDAPAGTLLAYATAPGDVAAEGEDSNGLYTSMLLKHMQTPGLGIEGVFKKTRADVMALSGDAQVPWESSSLVGDFYFVLPGELSSVEIVDRLPLAQPTISKKRFWWGIGLALGAGFIYYQSELNETESGSREGTLIIDVPWR